MSHSSSITLAEQRADNIIRLILYMIWGVILIFGIITLMQPVWLQSISEMGRESEAIDLKKMADDALFENRLSEAEVNYRAALKIDPDSQGAMGNLAITYAQMGKISQSKRTLMNLIERLPERAYVGYLNLGDMFKNRKEYQKALEYYEKAAELSPFPGHALKMSGYCSKQLGNTEEALRYYGESLNMYSDFYQLYLGSIQRDHFSFRGDEIAENPLDKLQKAASEEELLTRFDKTVFLEEYSSNGEISKIYNEIGTIYFRHEKWNLAGKSFRNALLIDPTNRQAKQNLKLLERKK